MNRALVRLDREATASVIFGTVLDGNGPVLVSSVERLESCPPRGLSMSAMRQKAMDPQEALHNWVRLRFQDWECVGQQARATATKCARAVMSQESKMACAAREHTMQKKRIAAKRKVRVILKHFSFANRQT